MKKMIREKEVMIKILSDGLIDFPSPSSISFMWNFGFMLGLFLVFQILTGLFLAFHYVGDMNLAFQSIIHLMRDVNSGWVIRIIHSNGASMFFLFLNFHLGRGIYYGSFWMSKVWFSGVSIYLVSMMVAFLGYVLPWGQMSFWAATVITNLLSAIPIIGVDMVNWIWGGYAVSGPTLTRFFSFHFISPFVLMVLVVVHLVMLHEKGSSNPLGLNSNKDKISFHPYFSMKDMLGLFMFLFFLFFISLEYPYMFMDSENFIYFNPMLTPIHIQPEWYFLFAYTILRSIYSKVGGVLALVFSVMIYYLFPFFSKSKLQFKSFYFFYKVMFWVLVVDWMVLTWIGMMLVEYPYVMLGQIFSTIYFLSLMFLFLVSMIQDKLI
uniref:Cytochrome b n=1 Tax=Atypus karschi TaxID=2337319 RepID=A0A8A5Y8S5_9ARAC|nr:cytochrome b [Atypus karschi]QTH31105.1 cytochrome b [Atypus karschi]